MADPAEDSEDAGAGRERPAIPTAIVVISLIVALVAVSGLLVVLFRRTTGPGEVLRDFARAMAADDCPGSYGYIAGEIRAGLTQDEWCELLPEVMPALSPQLSIGQRTFHEGVATIEVFGEETIPATWLLQKAGRSWEVLDVEDETIPFPDPP